MKRNYFLLLCVGLCAWGCGAWAYAGVYYKAVEQSPLSSEQIRACTEFSVYPIDYSAINPKDLGYSTPAEWEADKGTVPQAFSDAFPALLKEAKVSNKKISVIKSTDKPAKGIVAEVAVTQIVLNWNAWTNRPDEYTCKITLRDASSSQILYSGKFQVTSFSGNPFTSAWGSFSSRMQSAAFNMAWILTKIMADGKVDPAEY